MVRNKESKALLIFSEWKNIILRILMVLNEVNGTLTDNPKEIASFCSNFYSELYKSNYCKESASLLFSIFKETKSNYLELSRRPVIKI